MYYFDISGDLDSGCPGSERSPSALISNVSAMTRYVRKILNSTYNRDLRAPNLK